MYLSRTSCPSLSWLSGEMSCIERKRTSRSSDSCYLLHTVWCAKTRTVHHCMHFISHTFDPTLKCTLFCLCAKVMLTRSCECMRTLMCGARAKVRGLKGRLRTCGSPYNQFQRLLKAPVSLKQRPPPGVKFNLQTPQRLAIDKSSPGAWGQQVNQKSVFGQKVVYKRS